MILSLAILGLGCGGIFAYYKFRSTGPTDAFRVFSITLLAFGVSLGLFIIATTQIPFITNPFFYFALLFLPFFLAGIFYALAFKVYAEESFRIYAADLAGAAIGSVGAIAAINLLGPGNGIVFLMMLVFGSAASFVIRKLRALTGIAIYSVLIISVGLLLLNGSTNLLGKIPIGQFPEKDYYHVYPNMNVQSEIVDSRWSIYGRSDLVAHSHQNRVKHLFVDGAAGTQMYRFNGNPGNPDPVLSNVLLRFSSSVPMMFLNQSEKNSMLVIGPGGGKEVLTGLLTGVGEITGVEINPDFVEIVRDQRAFNGGIYTDFPNVRILIKEGRQFVRQTNRKYDLLVMVLPSTQQLQNIDSYALSENYLLTVEALQDYLDVLTPEGRLIFTVHNQAELNRLIITAIHAFRERGTDSQTALNHFMVLEGRYAPTLVIKKQPYTRGQISRRLQTIQGLPEDLPAVTYMPHRWNELSDSPVNRVLTGIKLGDTQLQEIVRRNQFDISPSRDDSPYFYKIQQGIPSNFSWLLSGVSLVNLLLIGLPLIRIRFRRNPGRDFTVLRPLLFFICIGVGFMIVEVTLFQKLVLYLGSPTVSLSILLSALLIGMGTGSSLGKKIYRGDHLRRLLMASILVVAAGVLVIALYPYFLKQLLMHDLTIRAIITFFLLLPFGFLLGIPFPTCIQIIKTRDLDRYIPWMYGVNGAMSILGSILAVILSMIWGFTPAFLIGIGFYFIIFIILSPDYIRSS